MQHWTNVVWSYVGPDMGALVSKPTRTKELNTLGENVLDESRMYEDKQS